MRSRLLVAGFCAQAALLWHIHLPPLTKFTTVSCEWHERVNELLPNRVLWSFLTDKIKTDAFPKYYCVAVNSIILVNWAWQTLSDSRSSGIIVIHSALTPLGATAGFSLQSLLIIWQVRRDSETTSNWGNYNSIPASDLVPKLSSDWPQVENLNWQRSYYFGSSPVEF